MISKEKFNSVLSELNDSLPDSGVSETKFALGLSACVLKHKVSSNDLKALLVSAAAAVRRGEEMANSIWMGLRFALTTVQREEWEERVRGLSPREVLSECVESVSAHDDHHEFAEDYVLDLLTEDEEDAWFESDGMSNEQFKNMVIHIAKVKYMEMESK